MTKNCEVKMMYYVRFGFGNEYAYEKGEKTLDKTRSVMISYLKLKQMAHSDVKLSSALIYKAKNKDGYIGKVVVKNDLCWWVTYRTIQQLSENGKVKKLMTYIPL